MSAAARFFYSPRFRDKAFGDNHPLSISRLGAVEDVCRLMGWFGEGELEACPAADIETLGRFHDPAYVSALREASRAGAVSVRDREVYNFGTMENPIFPGLFERAATTVGGSIRAAELVRDGGVGVHFGGGTHHGRRDRASGFCYFNDPVFAILTFLEGGAGRVAYVDLDAHHGDGVEDAFLEDPRVLTISVHEAERWPFSGAVSRGATALNAAVPAGFNDSELEFLMERWLLPALDDFRPDALVITCGADALVGDPLSRLELSNIALQKAVLELIACAPRAVALGGGGYNPWTTVRAWAGLWARIAGRAIPETTPPDVAELFRGFECDLVDDEEFDPRWIECLDDAPNESPVRDAVRALANGKRVGA